YTIATTASPTDGGTTTGSGTYTNGATCTVSATANNGFLFTNWTENDVEITSNSSYTFTVTENRTLVANFCAIPDPAGTISGNSIVCQGEEGITFSVPSIANATSYLWSLPNNVSG